MKAKDYVCKFQELIKTKSQEDVEFELANILLGEVFALKIKRKCTGHSIIAVFKEIQQKWLATRLEPSFLFEKAVKCWNEKVYQVLIKENVFFLGRF